MNNPDHAQNSRPDPVFFVGFPRSGTTLVEQILNQHVDIVTSDETPLIDNLIDKIPTIINTEKTFPDCLQDFSEQDYAVLRKNYWSEAENNIEGLSPHQTFVDKLPLNIIELGFISKLFPDSRLLVALRDPRDACLSCFMQSFTPNPAMINFINMKDTVDFYDNVMNLWLRYQKALPIAWHQYRYEDLVDDFETTTRNIFKFLELDYPENAERFHETAKNRIINTPSYQDVATPIYARRKARWKNYEKHFTPYMKQLAPLIKEFGY